MCPRRGSRRMLHPGSINWYHTWKKSLRLKGLRNSFLPFLIKILIIYLLLRIEHRLLISMTSETERDMIFSTGRIIKRLQRTLERNNFVLTKQAPPMEISYTGTRLIIDNILYTTGFWGFAVMVLATWLIPHRQIGQNQRSQSSTAKPPSSYPGL